MLKRGDMEIQFNWVFVLIVGTVILLFFARVTLQQKTVTESKIDIAVMADLDTITAGTASSRDTAQEIDIPDVELRLSADPDDCYRKFNIGANARRLENTFIFSPDRIEGRKVLTWTLDWSLPFRVTNLVILTSPLVRYIIIDDGATDVDPADQVYKTLHDELKIDFFVEKIASDDIDDLADLNHYKVRFIFFDGSPGGTDVSMFGDMPDKDVTAVNIIMDGATDGNTGQVEFYRKEGDLLKATPEGSSYYIKEEAMYAAIFSDNQYIYNCNMKAAFERLRFVSQLYHNRTVLLHNFFKAEPCGAYYYLAAVKDNSNTMTIRDYAKTFTTTFPDGVNPTEIEEIYNAAYYDDPSVDDNDGLSELNEAVLYNSCPEIY